MVEGGLAFMEWLVACAAENGEAIELVRGDPPAIEFTGTRARTEQVVDACRLAAVDEGWAIPSPFDGSAAGNSLMFRLWIRVHECLRDNGYPTVDPPSEDAFIDQGPPLWNPYAGFPSGNLLVLSNSVTPTEQEQRQLAAQELCGASAVDLYEDELAEQEGG